MKMTNENKRPNEIKDKEYKCIYHFEEQSEGQYQKYQN